MGRKIGFILFLSISLTFISTHSLHADVKNVKDCLEADEDCKEINEQQPAVEMEDDSDLVGNENIKTSSVVFNFIKMIFALLLVLALIYFILTFVKKRNKLFSNNNVLESVSGISVGPNKSIQMIRIGSKVYLIGVGDNVEMLQEITDEEVIESLLSEEEDAKSTSFIQSLLNRRNKDSDDNNTFTSTLESELKKIKDERTEMIQHYNEKDDRHG